MDRSGWLILFLSLCLSQTAGGSTLVNRMVCTGSCVSNSKCYSKPALDLYIQSKSESCKQMVGTSCDGESDHHRMSCREMALENITDCQPQTDEFMSRQAACSQCKSQCDTDHQSTPSFANLTECANHCGQSDKCLIPDKVDAILEGQTHSCTECLNKNCKKATHAPIHCNVCDKLERTSCYAHATHSCANCSDASTSLTQKLTTCSRCIRDCVLQYGNKEEKHLIPGCINMNTSTQEHHDHKEEDHDHDGDGHQDHDAEDHGAHQNHTSQDQSHKNVTTDHAPHGQDDHDEDHGNEGHQDSAKNATDHGGDGHDDHAPEDGSRDKDNHGKEGMQHGTHSTQTGDHQEMNSNPGCHVQGKNVTHQSGGHVDDGDHKGHDHKGYHMFSW